MNKPNKDNYIYCSGAVFDRDKYIDDLEKYCEEVEQVRLPKKVVRQFGGYCYCLSCNKDLSHSDKFMYCPDCGQALDWEE